MASHANEEKDKGHHDCVDNHVFGDPVEKRCAQIVIRCFTNVIKAQDKNACGGSRSKAFSEVPL